MRRALSILALALATIALAGIGFMLLGTLRDEHRQLAAEANDSAIWHASRLLYEVQELDRALWELRTSRGDEGVSQEAVRLRFDILWSRVSPGVGSLARSAYVATPGGQQAQAAAELLLAELDPLIDDLDPSDDGLLERLHQQFGKQIRLCYRAAVDIVHADSEQRTARRERFERLYTQVLGLFAISMLVGAALLAAVARSVRSLARMGRSLRARVKERTAALRQVNAELKAEVRERRGVEEKLRMLTVALEQSPNPIAITDPKGRLQYANQAYARAHDASESALVSTVPTLLAEGVLAASACTRLWQEVRDGRVWSGEYVIQAPGGSHTWLEAQVSTIRTGGQSSPHLLLIETDISSRKVQEDLLRRMATLDEVTGLPNRFLAFDRLEHALAHARREGQRVALYLIDLDRFKQVNDTLGHSAGDALLREVARRLSQCLRAEDTVARLGGDEFMAVLCGLEESTHAQRAAEVMLTALAAPVCIEGHEVFVSGSVGITLFPDDATDVGDLMRSADAAMYRAKEAGRNTFRFFTAEMNAELSARALLEAQLRRALEREEIGLAFQPIVDLETGETAAFEALARWRNPTLGEVPPSRFIPVAEESGLILPLGAWVLEQACQAAASWIRQTGPAPGLYVNVSTRQLRHEDFPAVVAGALSRAGLSADRLTLEVTESVVLDSVPEVSRVIETLIARGTKLAVDDFGTGYSSLRYLRQHPFDMLKIDGSFVRDVADDAEDAALVRAMLAMAHSIGLEAVGEGVETAAQAEFLRSNGCRLAQGWLFGRPISRTDVLAYLAREQALASHGKRALKRWGRVA